MQPFQFSGQFSLNLSNARENCNFSAFFGEEKQCDVRKKVLTFFWPRKNGRTLHPRELHLKEEKKKAWRRKREGRETKTVFFGLTKTEKTKKEASLSRLSRIKKGMQRETTISQLQKKKGRRKINKTTVRLKSNALTNTLFYSALLFLSPLSLAASLGQLLLWEKVSERDTLVGRVVFPQDRKVVLYRKRQIKTKRERPFFLHSS